MSCSVSPANRLCRSRPFRSPAAGPIRSFFAYWITMLAAGTFVFCCVLGLQGFAAQLLPRRWFLRASAFLQLAVFCLLVSGYFLQRSPVTVLVAGPQEALGLVDSVVLVRGPVPAVERLAASGAGALRAARMDRVDRRAFAPRPSPMRLRIAARCARSSRSPISHPASGTPGCRASAARSKPPSRSSAFAASSAAASTA